MPFAFEGEEERSLQSIPLDVHRKLELTGVKVSAGAWEALSLEQRERLVAEDDDFANLIAELLPQAEPAASTLRWRGEEALLEIEEHARALTIAINRTALDDRARYVLSRLIAGDEAIFRAAVAELGVAY